MPEGTKPVKGRDMAENLKQGGIIFSNRTEARLNAGMMLALLGLSLAAPLAIWLVLPHRSLALGLGLLAALGGLAFLGILVLRSTDRATRSLRLSPGEGGLDLYSETPLWGSRTVPETIPLGSILACELASQRSSQAQTYRLVIRLRDGSSRSCLRRTDGPEEIQKAAKLIMDLVEGHLPH